MPARRLTAFAILASLVFHLAFLPPAARWLSHDEPPKDLAEPAPIEMIVPLAEWILPSSPQNSPDSVEIDPPAEEAANEERLLEYVRTAQNQESLTSPTDPNFISDRNTLAQSPTPSREGPSNMPSVAGDEADTSDLELRQFRDGPVLEENPTPITPEPEANLVTAAPPQPSQEITGPALKNTAPFSPPLPEIVDAIPLPKPLPDRELGPFEDSHSESQSPTEAPKEIAEAAAQESQRTTAQAPGPPPAPSTVPLPDLDVPSFQSETRKAKLDGAAQQTGDAAFDTENTPIGRYHKKVGVAVERKWQRNIMANHDFHSFAKIRVKFTVNRWGKARNVEILKDEGNAVLTNQTVAAILQAEIPEMPSDVVQLLDQGELQCFFHFRIR